MRRLVLPAFLLVALYYAAFGGEYTAFDSRAIQQEIASSQEVLAELQAAADSVAVRANALEHDDHTLEKIARERFGMVREGEVLYRFAEPAPEGEEDR
ncbi:MAG: septum formation initiator family protein [Gemmatimonadota bacterium]